MTRLYLLPPEQRRQGWWAAAAYPVQPTALRHIYRALRVSSTRAEARHEVHLLVGRIAERVGR